MILRERYLEKLAKYINTEFIKVITGVRRSGKSYLLRMLKEELLQRGIPEEQIIFLNFESQFLRNLTNLDSLYAYFEDKVSPRKRMYFLLDEIQEVEGWQKVVNGLRVDFDADVYITGSNASLLSGELATYLSGRYVEIEIFPLSFQEFLDFKEDVNYRNVRKYYQEYRRYGGFPSAVLQNENELKQDVLNGIFDSILLKDVSLRGSITDIDLLLKVSIFLFSNIGQTVSVSKIKNALQADGKKVSANTIASYMNLLVNSFLFYEAKRYDIRGKEWLKSLGKYYVVDLGLRNTGLTKIDSDNGSQLENIVYTELLRRGYRVSVGKYDAKEIDFVATKQGDVQYIQVALRIPEENMHETDNLLYLPTGYTKKVIVEEVGENTSISGIPIIDVMDFLLEDYAERENLL